MRRSLRVAVVAAMLASGALTAVVAMTMANAATGSICDPYGSTTQGNYVIMNNRWNSAATGTQCINVTGNGLQITQQPNSVPVGGGARLLPGDLPGLSLQQLQP